MSTGSPKDIPNSTLIGGKEQPDDPALAASRAKSPATMPLVKNPELWISVGVGSTILVEAVVVAIIRKKSNNRRNRDVSDVCAMSDVSARVDATTHRQSKGSTLRHISKAKDTQQRIPLMCGEFSLLMSRFC